MSGLLALRQELEALADNLRAQNDENTTGAYHSVAYRIEQALHRFRDVFEPADDAQPSGLPDLTVAGEIRPGAGYLLSAARSITAQEADRIQEVLHARFPASTFGILTPGLDIAEIGQVAPLTWAELVNALERTEHRVSTLHAEATGATYWGAVRLLRILLSELAPERDGAAAPPAGATAAESATVTAAPSPLCGKPHPRFSVSCSKLATHTVYDPQHHDADAGVWWE